jgi:DNA-binding CsgD family transcriptional regulator
MNDLKASVYKAVLDLVTSIVNVKSLSAFSEMLISSKEMLGFTSVSLTEVQFHRTCTHKLIFTDFSDTNTINNYTVSLENYNDDNVLHRILAGEEVIVTSEMPLFANDVFSKVKENNASDSYGSYICILNKLNKETKIANILFFTINDEESYRVFNEISGYLHAHLLGAYVRIMSVSAGQQDTGRLSDREISVLTWLKYGKTSWEIAKILGITENTINFHIKNIKYKLHATNRQHAVAIALAKNIIE